MYSLFYSRIKLLFTASVSGNCGDDCCDPTAAGIAPAKVLKSHAKWCICPQDPSAGGFKAVFRRGDSLRETSPAPQSLRTCSCSLKAPEAKIFVHEGIEAPSGKLANHREQKTPTEVFGRFLRAGGLSIRPNELPSFWGWKHKRQCEIVKISLEQRNPVFCQALSSNQDRQRGRTGDETGENNRTVMAEGGK